MSEIGPITRGLSMAAGISPAGMTDSVYQSLLANRIIFLGSEVNSEIANRLCAQLILLEAEDPERDIKLYINSPGGSVYDGMAIYDTMQYIKNDVATVAMGMAASMGQLLLCAGTAGKRYALPHARIMMHQPSGGIGGVGDFAAGSGLGGAGWPSFFALSNASFQAFIASSAGFATVSFQFFFAALNSSIFAG